MFFWSSSELSTTVEFERNGSPSDSRREDELDAELAAAFSLAAALSLPRLPYLFFRYLAQELNAAPSFSPVPVYARKTNENARRVGARFASQDVAWGRTGAVSFGPAV